MAITGKNRQKIILVAIIAGIILLGLAVYYWTHQDRSSTASGVSSLFVVRRGELAMSVTESGTIKAHSAVEIKSRVERDAVIVSLVPEGSYITAEDVANGKILVELDSSGLRDTINQQQIEYNSAEADYTEARESLVIMKNQNDSDVQQGLMNVKFAGMDLRKYLGEETADSMVGRYRADPNQRPEITTLLDDPNQLGGESLQKHRELTSNIDLAKEELQRAEEDLFWTQKLFDKNYVAESELKTAELKAKRMTIQWEQSRTSLDLFTRYEFAKQAEKLFSDYLETKRELERIYAQTRSKLAQSEARLSSSKAKYLLNKEQLDRIKKQIEACTIRTTAMGLVIYASSDRSRRRGGTRTNIEVGESIYERQQIMTITNTDEMDVDVKVHETNVDKVRVGMPVKIVVDAQPDKVFTGEVLKIAPLPDPQSFFGNPDLKVYTIDVSMKESSDSIKPGMSARVEILIAQLDDVLSIPIQCVANRSGQKVCYRATANGPKEQVIQTGVFNDRFVQVLGGLQEGEQVLLSPPRLMMADDKSQKGGPKAAKPKKGAEKKQMSNSPPSEGVRKVEESPTSGGMPNPMKQMDKNGDGKIDLSSEVPEQARRFMIPLDTNKDGFLDKKEMDAAAKTFGGNREQTQ